MITNKGNQIITKYMLGQAPEYAGYIAVGVGAKPLLLSQSDSTAATKKSLDFEAFRVPVVSKGIVNDTVTLNIQSYSSTSGLVTVTTQTNHGIGIGDEVDIAFSSASLSVLEISGAVVTATTSNTFQYSHAIGNISWTSGAETATVTYRKERLVFKAQLPPDQYYKMTEVALFPSANNQLALGYDSKAVAGFLPTEGWIYHNVTDNAISFQYNSLSSGSALSASTVGGSAVFVNSINNIFLESAREARHESPRYLNKCLVVSGNMTQFLNDSMDISASAQYVGTSEISLNLSKNSPNDYVKLALSVVDQSLNSPVSPTKVRVRIEFIDTVSNEKAVATQLITSSQINASRYQVISKQLKDFVVGPNFNWGRVNGVYVYVQTLNGGGTYDNSYVVLDGIRIDNENTENPLYGMVCYSVLKNNVNDGRPIDKIENTQGYIEYRLGVSIF